MDLFISSLHGTLGAVGLEWTVHQQFAWHPVVLSVMCTLGGV